jgi:hypothetical protein
LSYAATRIATAILQVAHLSAQPTGLGALLVIAAIAPLVVDERSDCFAGREVFVDAAVVFEGIARQTWAIC